jgi:Family of unknown function (DUF6058)
MRRKTELLKLITALLEDAHPEREDWLEAIHARVDELDAIERPFAGYDRLRFGGPVSRDRYIEDIRRRFPRVQYSAIQT